MKDVCYLDLDGVLVNFVQPSLAFHGLSLPITDVRWGFPVQVGFKSGGDPDFWGKLGYDFWSTLPWTAEGPALLKALESKYDKNIAIFTSPCDTHGSVEGKVAWIKRELPDYRHRFFIGPSKHLAASPRKHLVDDRNSNIRQFRKHGGRTTLIPRPWNKRRAESDATGSFDIEKIIAELHLA